MNSPIQTAWVKPPFETGGLDHLGVQAPCIQIYGQLLPGITNVTDRARYYSFYLWLFHEFDKKGWRERDQIIACLRKADCLFTLVAIRHGQLHDNYSDHAGSAVGSNTLTSVVSALDTNDCIQLSDYAHLNDNDDTRYFMNAFGGLGQYYFGVLEGLRLMSGSSVSEAKLFKQTGVKIANAMSLGVSGDAFMEVVESGEVTLAILDELSSFCHCQLTSSIEEASLLVDVMREGWPAITGETQDVDSAESEAASLARSKSLALLIKLAGMSADSGAMFDVHSFRGATYSQCGFDNQPIAFSEPLSPMAGCWQVYQRNEVLAVAMQGLFYAMLRAVDLYAGGIDQRFMGTRELSRWFWHSGPGSQVLENEGAATLKDFLNTRAEALPTFGEWRNEAHEIQLIEQIVNQTKQSSVKAADLVNITSISLDALAAVCCRRENQSAYGEVQFRAGYLDPYPVNLNSVPNAVQQSFSDLVLVDALVKFTAHYCLDSHLRVAMRKLRQQGQNTSRFELTENGLVIKDVPPATHTSPRFNQSIRILRDLGLIDADKDVLFPSESGLAFLEAVS
tara:strand:- start:5832 stop:7523 length:1692 start_codon:yes stop_codon:yes gene_type:complete